MHAEARLAAASNERFQLASEKEREAERKLQEAQVMNDLLANAIPEVPSAPQPQDDFLAGDTPSDPLRDPRVDKLLAERDAEIAAKAKNEQEAAKQQNIQRNVAAAFGEVEKFLKSTGNAMPQDGRNAAQLITGMIETECGGKTDDFYKRLQNPNAILEKYHQIYTGSNPAPTPDAVPEPEPPTNSLASSAQVARNVEVDKLQARIDAQTSIIDDKGTSKKKYGKAVVERKALREQLQTLKSTQGG
jgi:hypothetical protein